MRLAPTKAKGDQERYVCTNCDDPIRDPIARHWVESPLKPPEE
jgi:hypothetical protein